MALHDPVGDRKSQPGAPPLRGVERLENQFDLRRRDSDSVVLHLDADPGPRGSRGRPRPVAARRDPDFDLALGLDRLIALCRGEREIGRVMPFPAGWI